MRPDNFKAVKARHQDELLRKPNVVGVGIGYTEVGGQQTEQLGLIIMVKKKTPNTQLAPQDRIPAEIEGVVTDVKEVGTLRALRGASKTLE